VVVLHAVSAVIAAYPLMSDNVTTIPQPWADSAEVDCNQYASVSASDYSSSTKSSMPVRLLRFDIFQRHLYVTYTSVTVMFSL